MAEDLIVLLDHIGWTEKRGVHVIGISLGGMIAQGISTLFQLLSHSSELMPYCTTELASKVPERVVSLTLIVTKSGGRRLLELPSVSPCFSM